MTGSDLVQVASLQTGDIEELQEAATDWDQHYCQMSPGQFEGGIELAQLGSRQIMRERWGRKVRYTGTAPPGSFGFAIPLEQLGTANWIGRPVHSNTVVLQAPGREADLISSAYWDSLVLGLPEDEVQSIVSVLSIHDDVTGELHGVVNLKQDATDKLLRLGLDFIRQTKLASSDDETRIQRMSEQFVKLFLWELVDAQEGSNNDVRPTKPSDIVRQATELVLSDRTNATGLTEICEHLGVSLRALHYAFQDVADMSPATWLRRIRLNQIRKILQQSTPNEILVKQVALGNGFFHLGHFSRNYKALFGELPSDTLSKTRTSLGYRRASVGRVIQEAGSA